MAVALPVAEGDVPKLTVTVTDDVAVTVGDGVTVAVTVGVDVGVALEVCAFTQLRPPKHKNVRRMSDALETMAFGGESPGVVGSAGGAKGNEQTLDEGDNEPTEGTTGQLAAVQISFQSKRRKRAIYWYAGSSGSLREPAPFRSPVDRSGIVADGTA